MHVVAPAKFADAQEIGDRFKNGQPVIVNLQANDRELARRMIDFCSGVTYALAGSMDKVADQVFLLTPSNVEVSAEEKRRLQERGLTGPEPDLVLSFHGGNPFMSSGQIYVLILLAPGRPELVPVQPDSPFNPVRRVIFTLTEPVLAPFRRIIPPVGMLDLSFLVAFIVVEADRQRRARPHPLLRRRPDGYP